MSAQTKTKPARTASRRRSAEERNPHDHYPTQPAVCEFALRLLPRPSPFARILDPGSGYGPWARAARLVWDGTPLILHGIDIAIAPTGGLGLYNAWWRDDFLLWSKRQPPSTYDYVIGNPPFAQAEAFVWSALRLLKPTGHLLYLLPSEFIGAAGRAKGLFAERPYRHEFQLTRRLDFIGGSGDMRWHSLFWWDAAWTAPICAYGPVFTMTMHDWAAPGQQLRLFAEQEQRADEAANGVQQLALFGQEARRG